MTETPTGRPHDEPGWRLVASWKRGQADSFGTYDGHRTLLLADPAREPAFSSVLSLAGSTLIRHRAGGANWETQDGWLTPTLAAFLDINTVLRETRLSVLSVPSGRPVPWVHAGQVRNIAPEGAMTDRWLTYLTGNPDAGMCAVVINIRDKDPRPENLTCAARGTILGNPKISGDSIVISRLVNAEDQSSRCKTLEIIDLNTGQHDAPAESDIARSSKCTAWDGVALGDVFIWDTMDPFSQNRDVNPAYARLPDGSLQPIGEVQTGSIVTCGDHAFWLDGRSNGVDAWKPGDAAARSILDPGENAIATALQCSADHWLSTRVDDISGQNEQLKLEAFDTRQLDS